MPLPLSSRSAAVLVPLVLALTIMGCGRKGSLEVPGPTVQTMQVDTTMGDTTVSGPARAPERRSRTARTGIESVPGEIRASDTRGANADAPETGDVVPAGPTTGDVVPRRRFVLDFLL